MSKLVSWAKHYEPLQGETLPGCAMLWPCCLPEAAHMSGASWLLVLDQRGGVVKTELSSGGKVGGFTQFFQAINPDWG